MFLGTNDIFVYMYIHTPLDINKHTSPIYNPIPNLYIYIHIHNICIEL